MISFFAFSQSRSKGYYITNSGDTINGYFVEYTQYAGYKSFRFSSEKWGDGNKMNHKDAIAYNNGYYHKRFPQLKKIFLKRLVSGDLNLYYWITKGQAPVGNITVVQYNDRTYYLQFKGEDIIHRIPTTNPAFRAELKKVIFEKYPEVYQKVVDEKWNAKELEEIVRLCNMKNNPKQ